MPISMLVFVGIVLAAVAFILKGSSDIDRALRMLSCGCPWPAADTSFKFMCRHSHTYEYRYKIKRGELVESWHRIRV